MTTETNRKGAIGELRVTSKLMELGYIVSEPVSDVSYDLVVEISGEFKRVQVKVCRWSEENNTYRVGFEKTSYNSEGSKHSTYTESELDAYAIYNPEKEEVYWLWFGEAPKWGASRGYDTWQTDRISEKLQCPTLQQQSRS